MIQGNKGVIEISTKELNKILRAYNTIGTFLEHHIGRELLYKEEFTQGMEMAFREVREKQTKKVKCFKDLGT